MEQAACRLDAETAEAYDGLQHHWQVFKVTPSSSIASIAS